MLHYEYLSRKGLFFTLSMWLYSRLLIAFIMLIIAPLFPVASNGVIATFSWDVFSAWDSVWYEKIVTYGYDFSSDVKQIHTVAFFPLFPLLCRLLIFTGLSFKVSSIIVNNLALLATLIILYSWVE